jgi:hypothetical protein
MLSGFGRLCLDCYENEGEPAPKRARGEPQAKKSSPKSAPKAALLKSSSPAIPVETSSRPPGRTSKRKRGGVPAPAPSAPSSKRADSADSTPLNATALSSGSAPQPAEAVDRCVECGSEELTGAVQDTITGEM